MAKSEKKPEADAKTLKKTTPQKAIDPSIERDELKEMIAKTKLMKAKMQELFDQISKKTGLTPDEIVVYFNNQSNFKTEKWEVIQKYKATLETLSKDMPLSKKAEIFQSLNSALSPKKRLTSSRADKSKTAAVRRKWIPMS